MLCNQLVDCPRCKSTDNYEGGGGTLSMNFSQQNFYCSGCDYAVLYISASGSNALLFFKETNGDVVVDWLNDVVMGHWRSCAEECSDGPVKAIPPRMPPEVENAFICNKATAGDADFMWTPVSHELSQSQQEREDPIAVNHRCIFERLRERLPSDIEGWKPIENRYRANGKNEPWYFFRYKKFGFIIGPRKRVYSLGFYSDSKVDFSAFDAFGKSENVTYVDSQNEFFGRGKVIHAWGQQKMHEYLQKMIDFVDSQGGVC